MTLKKRALEQLREWRRENGNCYQTLERLVNALDCKPEELFDWDSDTGVLLELVQDGDVCRIGTNAFIAYISPWENDHV